MIDQEEKSLTELADDLAEAQKRTETLKSLEERIGSEVQAKESAQGALRALELEKTKLGTDIKTYKTTIAQLSEQKVDASKYEEQLAVLKERNKQYESTIANLKTTADNASEAAKAWEGQYNSILKEKESLGQAAQAMKAAMLKANGVTRETVANYQVLKQKCLEVMQQNADLQAKLELKQ
jgi:chromosome segregation ATPase